MKNLDTKTTNFEKFRYKKYIFRKI